MEHSIYYTFSTIPQVLAGAIALLGVFLIFKLQIVNRELIGFGEHMIIEIERIGRVDDIEGNKKRWYSRLEKAIARRDLSDVKKQIDTIADYLGTPSMREYKTDFETKDANKRLLIEKTKSAIILSAIVICFSVAILPITKFVASCLPLYTIIYVLIILALICCMYLMIRVIYKALAI